MPGDTRNHAEQVAEKHGAGTDHSGGHDKHKGHGAHG